MRIAVCIKQVYGPEGVRVSRSREMLDTRSAELNINPYDKHALEAALSLKDHYGGTVVALSVGGEDVDDALREALAIGADEAYLLSGDALEVTDANGVAKALAAAVNKLGEVNLVITGQKGVDTGAGDLPGRLAEALGWPLLLDVEGLSVQNGTVEAIRDVDGKSSVFHSGMPAVVAISPVANYPRYAHVARVMNAYREWAVTTWTSEDLGLEPDSLAPKVSPRGMILPPKREIGSMLSGTPEEVAKELVAELRQRRLV